MSPSPAPVATGPPEAAPLTGTVCIVQVPPPDRAAAEDRVVEGDRDAVVVATAAGPAVPTVLPDPCALMTTGGAGDPGALYCTPGGVGGCQDCCGCICACGACMLPHALLLLYGALETMLPCWLLCAW